jgi:putative transcriptional regulator
MRPRLAKPIAILLLALVAVHGSAGAAAEPEWQPASLAGQFLVASPKIGDPRFARTVIFMVSHDQGGAMGLVINRVFGEGRLSRLLAGFGITTVKRDATIRLYSGGPVEPGRGFVLHSGDYQGKDTRSVAAGIALTSGRDVLEALAAGNGPQRTLIVLGYAGWVAGQLESELARDDWLIAPADAAQVFTDRPDRIWQDTLRRAGTPL